MQKIFTTVLVSILVVPSSVLAQETSLSPTGAPSPLQAAAIKEAARLAMTLASGSAGQAQPPKRTWTGRHPILVGALVGFAAGAASTFIVIPQGTSDPRISYLPILGGFGAGIGAGIGVAVSALRR